MPNTNAHDWLNAHGDYLYRFALARLRDTHLAEDAVRETFLAAVKSANFAEQSAPRTWLTGILKHKIVDTMRKSQRETAVSDILADQDANMDDFFDEKGRWAEPVQTWDVPHEALEQKQFLRVMQDCVNKLPKNLADLFLMREVHEESNEEICKAFEISATNAWVMLYRARTRLRKCMEINWLAT